MEDPVAELEKYYELQNDEIGEACSYLCALAGYSPYLSTSFNESLREEIASQLENFRQNSRIVKKTRTETWEDTILVWDTEDDVL